MKDEKLFHLMFHDKKNGNFLMHQMKLHLIHYSYALMEYFGNLRLDIKPYERNFKYLKFLFNLILNENTIQFEKNKNIKKHIRKN